MLGPELDIRTLLAMVGAVGLVNAAAWLRWSRRHAEFSGLAFFAGANAALAFGMYLVSMRGELPELATTVMANLVTLCGLLLNHEGLRRFAGKPWPAWRSPLWLLLPLGAGSAWYTVVDPSVHARILVFTGCAALGCAWIAWDLARSTAAAGARLQPAAWVFGGFALLLALRWTFTVTEGPLDDFMNAGRIHELMLVAYIGFILFKDLALFDATVARVVAESRRLADIDPLTGLVNRRDALTRGARLLDAARQRGRPLSALMIDVDRFKSINDRHGHAVGDAVLVRVAEILAGALPSQGLVARVGGEEFLVLLPDTPIEAAAALAERMRHALATHPWPDPPGAAQSASFGVAATTAAATLDALILRADRALLAAKSAGRDRVVVDTADGGDAAHRALEQLDSATA
jgi:diguanylate cyclase (GGDEF)-like protein